MFARAFFVALHTSIYILYNKMTIYWGVTGVLVLRGMHIPADVLYSLSYDEINWWFHLYFLCQQDCHDHSFAAQMGFI